MRVVGPVTKSPQAKTPRTFVTYVAGSTLTRPRLTSKADSTGRKVRSAACETAGMMRSAGMTNSEPSIGTGDRRPGASGAPSRFQTNFTPVTWPLPPGPPHPPPAPHELGPRPAVDDRDSVGSVAQRGARTVHGRVAATDDHDVAADRNLLAEVGALHEVDAVVHPFEVRTRDVDPHPLHP